MFWLQLNSHLLTDRGFQAAIDFARLAGFRSAGVIVEIMNEDGTMARLPQLIKIAERFNLKIISIV